MAFLQARGKHNNTLNASPNRCALAVPENGHMASFEQRFSAIVSPAFCLPFSRLTQAVNPGHPPSAGRLV